MQTELPIVWSTWYHPEWDMTPEAYLEAHIVAPTRSRRLGHYMDPVRKLKGYVGVYHMGEYQGTASSTRFFLSLFSHGHPLGLRSFVTINDLLMILEAFHMQDERWGNR